MTNGTPKTLIDAIYNGINDSELVGPFTSGKKVKAHVQDLLSQYFQTAMFDNPEANEVLMKLWKRIADIKTEGEYE